MRAKDANPGTARRFEAQADAPNRREFLYYIWGASMIMLMGGTAAGLIWFAMPKFKEGEFGGIFELDPAEIPAIGQEPNRIAAGRFYLIGSQK